ncbi:MAG: ribonuclease M5 [Erysipelotrichaceae bacterium]|nr:ribonuclease M5 [Erysipelotrichaceae bacterium]
MEKIREVVIVEGKSDTINLSRYYQVDTIETNGLGLDKKTIDFIKEVNNKRGVILLLDPDGPGEKIRSKINQAISGLKNAFVDDKLSRKGNRVGVEYASKQALDQALSHIVTYKEVRTGLSVNDLYHLDLAGKKDSSALRDKVARHYHLGHCNSKTLLKRLNMLEISYQELEELLSV